MSIMYATIHNVKLCRTNPFFSFLCPLRPHIHNPPKTLTLTLEMGTQSGSSKRPECPSCCKPTRVCLCTRFKTPKIDNSVAITILQHSLEKNHPLNSTRIASIGLKNVNVVSVFDVNYQAGFSIQVLHPDPESGFADFDGKRRGFCGIEDSVLISGGGKDSNFRGFENYPDEKMDGFVDLDGELSKKCDFDSGKMGENCMVNNGLRPTLDDNLCEKECIVREDDAEVASGFCRLDETAVRSKVTELSFHTNGAVSRGSEGADICFSIEKYGVNCSFDHGRMALGQPRKLNFEKLLGCGGVMDDLAKGFIVKKLQRKQLKESLEYEECEEFEIIVPCGSVLLFPSEKAVGIEDIDFELKNLIVLDGTWAKATRMYNENPWLKALPHLKLDIDKLSLYAEVRQQPRAGYLSTIESIVYALKAFEDHSEELDGLLDVFDSMVGDQRRCKDERLSSIASNLPMD